MKRPHDDARSVLLGHVDTPEKEARLSTEGESGPATLVSPQQTPLSAVRRSGSISVPLRTGINDIENGTRAKKNTTAVVSWRDLPQKAQLAVITCTRLSEPLVQTSLQSYMFYQLKWFDPTQPDSVISTQAGILNASFTAAQFVTAMMWGRIADSTSFGRKSVLLIGLVGTTVSCVGFGFSTSFWQALCFRILGGATNGNVGVMRTMISEIIKEKKYQSRAFLLLPMTFNIGVIIGPILGGLLSDPAGSYPALFGKVDFLRRFPYATPNLVSAVFLLAAAASCWLLLEETLDSRRDKFDIGIALGNQLKATLRRCLYRDSSSLGYTPLPTHDTGPTELEMSPITPTTPTVSFRRGRRPRFTTRLPFRRVFTRNVIFTFVANFLLAFHVGTFNSLWFVFLSTPVHDPAKPPPRPARPPFVFTGGMGMAPQSVGLAMAVLGVLGISLQLFVYPALSARLGTLRSWRLSLCAFPLTYLLVPFLALLPSGSAPPRAKDGAAVWLGIAGVLAVQVAGRTFALPAQTILINNCTPHPSVLGTVHGLGQSVSSFARTVGPMLCGWLYGLGLREGVVGAVFWGLGAVALCGVLASWWVREGDGHEIWLEGDEEGDEGRDGEGDGDQHDDGAGGGGRGSVELADRLARGELTATEAGLIDEEVTARTGRS